MAVPESCNQYVSAKLKILFLMMISSMSRKRFVGKSEGSPSLFVCRKFLMDAAPIVMSMLVYIDFVSAVITRAFPLAEWLG